MQNFLFGVLAASFLFLSPKILCAQTPDAIYPLPSNNGNEVIQGVNLFNGNVNTSISLAKINGNQVTYELKAFYNSRSAALINQSAGNFYLNELGGYGWKLMDYPKIAQSGGLYYLLDGYNSYQLTSSGTNAYTPGGKYYLWQVLQKGSTQFEVATPDGKHYLFTKPPVQTGNVNIWSFNTLKDALWGDSISLQHYPTGHIQQIYNSSGDSLYFQYSDTIWTAGVATYAQLSGSLSAGKDGKYLQAITHRSNGNLLSAMIMSYKTFASPNGTKYNLFSSVEHYHQIYGNTYDQMDGGYDFTYLLQSAVPPLGGDAYTGAMTTFTDPMGAVTIYSYKANGDAPASYSVMEYAVDDGYNNNSGDTIDPNTYTAIHYNLSNVVKDPAGIYLQYNLVEVFPGGRMTPKDTMMSHPYGSLQYYFLNGSTSSSLIDLPTDYNKSIVSANALRGFTYLFNTNADSSVHNPDEQLSSSVYYWNAGTVAGFGNAQVPWIDKLYNQQHGVGKWHTYSYGTPYHLLSQIATTRRTPEPLSPLNNTDSVINRMQYAFQQYPALAASGIHLLNRVSQEMELVQEDLQGPFHVTSCHCTQWSQWSNGIPSGSGNWAPVRTVTMRDSTADTSNCYTVTKSSSQWLVNTTYQQRNQAGLVLDSSDAMGNHSSTLYAAVPFSTVPVAHFQNAAISESAYLGFEAYENTGNWAISGNGSLSNVYPHTGKDCFMPNSSGTPYNRFTPARQNQPYLFSLWYRNGSTPGYVSYQYFDSANNRYASKQYTLPASNGAWTAFSFVLDFPAVRASVGNITLQAGIYIFTGTANTDFAIDDLSFSPVSGRNSADVYDINRDYLTASVGMNAQTTYYIRDRFDRQIAQQGPGGSSQISDVTLPYNSRQGSLCFSGVDTFSAIYPNMELTLNSGKSGVWESFSNPATPNFPATGVSNMQIGQNWLLTLASPAYATFANNINQPDVALYTELFPNNPGINQEAGFSLQLDSLGINGAVAGSYELRLVLTGALIKLYYGNQVLRSTKLAVVPEYNTLLVTISNNNFLIAYLNGRYVFDCYLPQWMIGGPAKLVSTNPGAAFDNFLFLDHVQSSLATFDALLRPRQNLVRSSFNQLQVTEILYGGPLNLPVARTRTGIIGGNNADSLGLSYQPNFASGFNYDSMTLSNQSVLGAAAGYQNPFDASFSYSKSPLLELTGFGGGSNSTAGKEGDKYTRISYSNAQGNTFNYTPNNLISITKTGSDSTVRINYVNSENVLFGEVRYKGADTLKTQYEYDRWLHRVKTYQPDFFNNKIAGNKQFVVLQGYDFTGNIITDSTTDAGVSQSVYDLLGHVRFRMDAAGADFNPDTIVYTKYDPMGRITEQGIFAGPWNRNNLQLIADNNPAFPGAGDKITYYWKKQFQYDLYGADSVYQGNLITAYVNNNNDGLPDVKESYWYDSVGRVSAKGLQVFAFDSVLRKVEYNYDHQGRVLNINFPGTGYPGLVYQYDGTGAVTSIGIPGDSMLYAAYDYGYSTIEYLNRQSYMRNYNYNEKGNISSINDPLFNENILYDTANNNGSGGGKIQQLQDYNKTTMQTAVSTFSYDNNGRLTVADLGADNPWSLGLKTPLSYDDNGNILSLQTGRSGPLQFQYNSGTNRINTIQGFQKNYVYNGNGSITVVPYGTSDIRYDFLSGRTLSMVNPSRNTMNFTYNGEDQRVLKTVTYGVDSVTQRLYVHGLNDYPLYEVARSSKTAPVSTFYIYGPMGLVALQQGNQRYFMVRDYLHSTRMVIDSNNTIQATFNYSTMGSIASSLVNPGLENLPLNYLYTGQEYDSESGLYNYRDRMYDPGTGRFYATDPKRQYPSPYVYAGNNPVSKDDPTGEWGWGAIYAGLAIAAVGLIVIAAVVVTVASGGTLGPIALGSVAAASKIALGLVVLGTAIGIAGQAEIQSEQQQSAPTPSINAMTDGISFPVNVNKDTFAVPRPIEGRYSIIDLKYAQPFVPDNSKNTVCPIVPGTPLIFPYRPIIAAKGQTPKNNPWVNLYSKTLYINANFFEITADSTQPYDGTCTTILGVSVSNNQSISNWTAYPNWSGGSLKYYLDALVIYKPNAPAANGRYADIIRYKDLSNKFISDNVAYAVGGIYYIRNGKDTSAVFGDVVNRTKPNGRTVASIDNSGRYLLLLEVDYNVPNIRDGGLSFAEMVNFFTSKGFNNVLNLDGNGSSAFYYQKNATIISSKPMDTYKSPIRLHRPIPNFIGFK